jgi:hypothetical protein
MEGESFLMPQGFGVSLTFLLHSQSSIEGSLRMILMGKGGTKQGKDTSNSRDP